MKSFDDELVHKTVAELFDMVKSRQSEVDNLEARLKGSDDRCKSILGNRNKILDENVELKKRIDDALIGLCEKGKTKEYRIDSVFNILKGENHES